MHAMQQHAPRARDSASCGHVTGPEKAQTEVKRGCEVRLAGRHAAEKLQRCWGCSATSSLDETRASIANLLKVPLSHEPVETTLGA